MAIWPIDINHFYALDGNQPIAASALADLCANDVMVTNVSSPLAQQTGPHASVMARFVDGLGSTVRLFDGSSNQAAAMLAGWKQDLTFEMAFKAVDSSASEDTRMMYSLSSGTAPSRYQWAVTHVRSTNTVRVTISNGPSNGQYSFDFGVTISLGTWYYLAVRKTVTSGTTNDDRLNTYEMWCIPLSGEWEGTPNNTLTGQPNPSPSSSSGFHQVVGGRWSGSVTFFRSSYYFAGLRASNIARDNTFLQASFYQFKYGLSGEAPEVPYVPADRDPAAALCELLDGETLAGVLLTAGSNLFSSGRQKPTSTPAVFLLNAGGGAPTPFLNNHREALYTPTVQVLIEGNEDSWSEAEALARAVFDELQLAVPPGYVAAFPRDSQPAYLGENVWVINFEVPWAP